MQATEPGGTCDRIQIRGRILAPPATGSRSSGEQLGGATLGVVSLGMGRRVRSGGGGPPGLTLSPGSGPKRAPREGEPRSRTGNSGMRSTLNSAYRCAVGCLPKLRMRVRSPSSAPDKPPNHAH